MPEFTCSTVKGLLAALNPPLQDVDQHEWVVFAPGPDSPPVMPRDALAIELALSQNRKMCYLAMRHVDMWNAECYFYIVNGIQYSRGLEGIWRRKRVGRDMGGDCVIKV
jgi:hypothetical protein